MDHERQGSGYDPGARGHELLGRETAEQRLGDVAESLRLTTTALAALHESLAVAYQKIGALEEIARLLVIDMRRCKARLGMP